jgi:sulfate/thiosulfate transport system ATP-binding protein
MSIDVKNASKTFGAYRALRDVSLHVPTGKLVALLGPSGSGKTTLLRIIAGLETPDPGSGPILFSEEDVARRRVGERRVGFVFQHYALFRHMTVFENVAFGLRVRPRRQRPPEAEIRKRAEALLELVQLGGLAQRRPTQLSGGQRQRVALARALAVEPEVLLLDEPFGALDAKVRKELRAWLRRLHETIHVTTVFVTHDQDEALEVADEVVVMNTGTIEQVGTPDEVFHQPATEFVMDFLGHVNRFPARVAGGKVRFAETEIEAPAAAASGEARVFVRPHDLDVELATNGHGAEGAFRARVVRVHSAGPTARLELESESGEPFIAHVPLETIDRLKLSPDQTVQVKPRNVRVFGLGAGI